MGLSEQLKDINALLESFDTDQNANNERALMINAEIASLRMQLADLQSKNLEIKRARNKTIQERESVERKLQLEHEAEALKNSLIDRMAEAQELIKDAPWLNDAFDWQIEGAVRLPDRAILGDKRGLGKTLSSIIWRKVKESKRTLVCLRKEVASDFIKELKIREPDLFVFPMTSANSDTRKMAAMMLRHTTQEFVVVANIEQWRRDVDKVTAEILKIGFDAVILDEAHNIKNTKTGTAQGFFRIADAVPKVLELTGTPIKNRPQELFSLLHSLYPETFVTEKKFLLDFCMQIDQNRWAFSEWGLTDLMKKISHFFIARTPEDVGRKIPPPRMIEYKLDFSGHSEQAEAYKIITERNMAILNSGDAIPITSQLAIMTRQAQVATWPAGIEFKIPRPGQEDVYDLVKFDVHQSVKLDWAEDLIGELVEEGERVVLFSRFKPPIYELKKRLETNGLSVAVVSGDESSKNTEEVLNDFDLKTAPKNPRWQVCLATYQTIGESANLNSAAHMILLDRYWNPGNDDQAIGRIDRINSTRQATIHLPEIEKTIDEYMVQLIQQKRDLVNNYRSAYEMQTSLTENLRKSL